MDAASRPEHDVLALARLIDEVVPEDPAGGTRSASAAGGVDFLLGLLDERPDWRVRLRELLASAADPRRSEHWPWFAQLVQGGYWADAGNGGNRGEANWAAIGWPGIPRGGWSRDVPVAERPRVEVQPRALATRYDAIVIGSGAGGGVAAAGLAESGRTVLVVEAGGWPSIAELAGDHLRNPRSDWGLLPRSGPVQLGLPRRVEGVSGESLLEPHDAAWRNNAFTAGGGTRVYGAQAWRFAPQDFTMASDYGVPEGSALADWPIRYEDLEPYYVRAEWEIGVSGEARDGDHAGPRSRAYPMPPLPAGIARDRLARAATSLGLETLAVPLLVNSREHLGRGACEQCGQCIGFSCPVDAKNGSQNTVLARAFATGRCQIVLETRAERLIATPDGRVSAVVLVGERDGRLWRATVEAEEFVLAAGATESPRLLLNSGDDSHPDGLGNAADQVGRHLQGHLYAAANALFDEEVEELIGPGPSIATTRYRHGNPGIVGGGIIANEFVPTPSNLYRYLVASGFIPADGVESVRGMRHAARRLVQLRAPAQEVTMADSRVRVDPSVRDRFGIPIARLTGSVHPEDLRTRAFLRDRAEEWLRAAGPSRMHVAELGPVAGPSAGQHGAGTLRMGDDPARSAVDPWGRVWGHPNLRVVDGSVHVTNGGVNPVLSIFANAFRIVDDLAGASSAGTP